MQYPDRDRQYTCMCNEALAIVTDQTTPYVGGKACLRCEGSVLEVGSRYVFQVPNRFEGIFELLIKLDGTVHPEGAILQLHNSTTAAHIYPKPAKRTLCSVDTVASRPEHLSCTA